MEKLGWILAVTIAAFILPADAADRATPDTPPRVGTPEAVTDTLKPIYRVSGVRDDGAGAGIGVATSFHCTNWSNTPEKLAIAIYDFDGRLLRANSFFVDSHRTFTMSTHATHIFDEDAFLAPGVDINQGFAHIAASSTNFYCSAMSVDAANVKPLGISLHLVRVNPVPGTTE